MPTVRSLQGVNLGAGTCELRYEDGDTGLPISNWVYTHSSGLVESAARPDTLVERASFYQAIADLAEFQERIRKNFPVAPLPTAARVKIDRDKNRNTGVGNVQIKIDGVIVADNELQPGGVEVLAKARPAISWTYVKYAAYVREQELYIEMLRQF